MQKKKTLYDVVNEMPLPDVLGYLANIYQDIQCTCWCFKESWLGDLYNQEEAERSAIEHAEECKQKGKWDKCIERMAFEKVLKAVKKQTQKKPIHETVTNDVQGFPYKDVYVRCPSCGNRFYSIIDGEIVAGKKTNYCSECGQRIDWSDLE